MTTNGGMIMKSRKIWLRTGFVLALVGAGTLGALRLTHQGTANAQVAVIAPPGCPSQLSSSTVIATTPALEGYQQDELPKESIALRSFQWGVGRGISSPTGGSADRESSTPSVSEITITKEIDASSPKLFELALSSEGADWSIFEYRAGGTTRSPACLRIDLQNVLISSFRESGGGDMPSESLTLNFTKVSMENFSNRSTSSLDSILNYQGRITVPDIGL